MNFLRKLPIPQEIKAQYPLTDKLAAVKAARDAEIRDVFTGKSDKFVLVIGPCSADFREPVLEYISRLREVQEKVKDKIIIIPLIKGIDLPHLFQKIGTADAAGLGPGLIQCRQQQSSQNRDDRNHHKEFYQCEDEYVT